MGFWTTDDLDFKYLSTGSAVPLRSTVAWVCTHVVAASCYASLTKHHFVVFSTSSTNAMTLELGHGLILDFQR